ncbi:hypothetical protein Tco_0574095, partial [Tanacetum coccineum]
MVQGMEEERMGIGSREGPTILALLDQTNTCRTIIKEKIEASRTLTGKHDQHDKIGENPKKLTCNESKREELEDPQYEKQTCEKSLISGIREKELLGNFYMKIPEQKFRSSYGSMPLKGRREKLPSLAWRTGKEAFQMLVRRHQGIQRYEIDRPTSSRVTVLRCSIQKQHVIQRYEINRPTLSRVMVLRRSIQKRHVIQRYEIDRPTSDAASRSGISYKDMKLIVRHHLWSSVELPGVTCDTR